jgi:hypothetical protein
MQPRQGICGYGVTITAKFLPHDSSLSHIPHQNKSNSLFEEFLPVFILWFLQPRIKLCKILHRTQANYMRLHPV